MTRIGCRARADRPILYILAGATARTPSPGGASSPGTRDPGRTGRTSLQDVRLDPPLTSSWKPVLIETLRDNLAAKMNALVGRGAPRDFVDVFELCRRGFCSVDDCWNLWLEKNAEHSIREAKLNVLRHLELIEARRPLLSITDDSARARAQRLRDWVRAELCGRAD